MCNAGLSAASIPQLAAVFVVGRVALVGEIALPVSTAGWDTGRSTYVDVGPFVTTNTRPSICSGLLCQAISGLSTH